MIETEFKEVLAIKNSPWKFMTEYVITQDPIKGELKFPRYLYLKKLITLADHERYLLVPKSRQMTVTWSMIGFFLWKVLFEKPGLYLFLSRNERCAEELLDRAKFIWERLPEFMKVELSVNSKSELCFGPNGSRILSLPATPDGPRMYAPTGVFWDEMAFTPYDESIWSALKPALDSGGKFVGVSSSGGAMNLFAKLAGGENSKLETQNSKTEEKLRITNYELLREETPPYSPPQAEGLRDAPNSSAKARGKAHSLFKIYEIHYSLHPKKRSEKWKLEASAGLSASRWEREQEISFTAEHDLVYAEFSPQRHLLSYIYRPDPDLEIYRTIDFGYRNPAVLWIQRDANGDYIVFDEWIELNRTTEQLYEAILQTDFYHGISERKVKWTACDPAGDAAQDSGLSPVAVLRNKGMKIHYRPSRIATGIELVRVKLLDARHESRLRISPRCKRLIADFQRYQWGATGEEPIKDGISDHSMDALRYFFVNLESKTEFSHTAMVRGGKR